MRAAGRTHRNDVGGVVSAISVHPQSAALGDRAHQIEARAGSMIRRLVEIGEAKKGEHEQRNLYAAIGPVLCADWRTTGRQMTNRSADPAKRFRRGKFSRE